jgi:hypothetical protein
MNSVLTFAAITAFTFAATSANAAPIGHWTFDDGSGPTAVDSSGNGYDADRVNTDGSWTTGKAGGAYNQPRFTLDAAESAVLNLAGTGAVTLSAWVTPRTGSTFEGIAGFEGTGADGDIYSLKVSNTDNIVWTVNSNEVQSTDTLSNYAATTGDGWVHLVGVFDQGNTSALYVNGSLVSSGAAAASIVDKTPPGLFRIGAYYNSTNFEFGGSIDDVQVYDTALSADDVAFLFNNPGSALGEIGVAGVPEPSTLVLAALGLLGLMATRRRRRR